MRGDGVRSSTEIKVMRKVERVSQELTFDQYSGSMYIQDTHGPGNLDLVIDAAALGVVVCFILDMTFETLAVYGFRLHVRVVVLRFLGLGLVVYRRRNLAEPFAGIPDLEDDVEDFPVDLPRCTAQDIQASIHEFEIAQR